ncbi:thiol:disulfide interchange protein DsbA/DsbL [Ferrimonas senticii]|uniref:thiol:disulfide interchange protein DsbA/DsbL n=1 Tax=Ferrimonas senticii TaxID=394566 RepID=UPI000401FE98|nr:thiol:disulfide interchange protein DsbA/DsbL [Ferrimonas senticii]
MKKLIAAVCLSMASVSAWAADFREGLHYYDVNPNGSTLEPTVTEFFSLYCGNCYNMESKYLPMIVPDIEKRGIKFEQKHVNFSRDEQGVNMVRAFVIMTQLPENKPLKDKLFELNHAKDHDHSAHVAAGEPEPEKTLKTMADIRKVFVEFGVDGAKFDELANSDFTNNSVKMWDRQQSQFRIESIPTFIVNNRYQVNMGSIRTVDELIEMMDYLSKK